MTNPTKHVILFHEGHNHQIDESDVMAPKCNMQLSLERYHYTVHLIYSTHIEELLHALKQPAEELVLIIGRYNRNDHFAAKQALLHNIPTVVCERILEHKRFPSLESLPEYNPQLVMYAVGGGSSTHQNIIHSASFSEDTFHSAIGRAKLNALRPVAPNILHSIRTRPCILG